MITGAQCRAARALVEVTASKLARRSGVDASLIEAFEDHDDNPDPAIVSKLRHALEELGAAFIDENGGGVGVRLKYTRSETRQMTRMEDEGGIPASDTVP